MFEISNCISLKREHLRVSIRRQKNEEIFSKSRKIIQTDNTALMNYLISRNEDDVIFNLKEFIENRSQNIYESQQILKWLLEYEKLNQSTQAQQLTLFFLHQVSLNIEVKYIKLAASLLKQICFQDEDALNLTTKLSHKSTMRSQIFINELSNEDFIIDLMGSQLNTLELICNIMADEQFIYLMFNKHPYFLDYFIAKLHDLRSCQLAIDLFYDMANSEKLCPIISNKHVIHDLILLIPSQRILEILILIHQHSYNAELLEEINLIKYYIELLDSKMFLEEVLFLINFMLDSKLNQFLLNQLLLRKKHLQDLCYCQNHQVNQLAANIVDKYL
ncbi:unnamed protein product [Paramecium pentaurelia]|uniref:Uncharacterized protein n=1 Tax=Paramecium pentaurelia TaxID=43138 RepID=A0A8S1SE70_9CILI|nr:unnamed protein product [Paramecium pentaurelia]